MRFDNVQGTEIVQLPAVSKGGLVEIFNPDLMKLPPVDLKNIAELMGGELIFVKVRATYTMPEQETQFCTFRDCWQLGERTDILGRCDKHISSSS